MISSEFFDLISTLLYLLLGVIMYPGNQQYIVTSASGQTVMTSAYPSKIVLHYVSSAEIYPNQSGVSQGEGGAQVSSTTYYPNLVVASEARTAGPMQGATSVTYPDHGPPPAYQRATLSYILRLLI